MLSDLFIKVFMLSISSVVVIGLLFVIRYFLKSSPKIYSYTLWGVVLVRLLVPFSIESDFSLLPNPNNMVEKSIILDSNILIETKLPVTTNTPNSENENVESFTNTEVDTLSTEEGSNINSNITNTFANNSNKAVTEPTTVNETKRDFIIQVSSIIWLVGFVFLTLKSVIDLKKLKKSLDTANLYKANIFFSENIQTAFVLGVCKPKIYLPLGLDENTIEYIIKHEETHIKRKDPLIRYISFLALCIHWFNPFVWLAYSKSSEDMEMSCDERVLKELGVEIKKDYSTSVLALATGSRKLTVHLAFSEKDTKSRIKNVLNYKKPKVWLVLVSVLVVIISSVLLLTSQKDYSTINEVELSQFADIEIDNISRITAVAFDPFVLNNRKYYTVDNKYYNDVYEFLSEMKLGDNLDGFVESYRHLIEIDYYNNTKNDYHNMSFRFSENFKYVYIYDDYQLIASKQVVNPLEVKLYFESLQDENLSEQNPTTQQINLGSYADVFWSMRTPYIGEPTAFGELRVFLPLNNVDEESTFEITDTNGINSVVWNIETKDDYIDIDELYQSARISFAVIGNLDEIKINTHNTVYNYTNTYNFSREKLNQIFHDNEKLEDENRVKFTIWIEEIFNTDYNSVEFWHVTTRSDKVINYPIVALASSTLSSIATYPLNFTEDLAYISQNFITLENDVCNIDLFEDFVAKVEKGESSQLFLTNYTEEEVAIVSDIIYDGNVFNVITDARRDAKNEQTIAKQTYKNLVTYIDNENSSIYYYLTDLNNVTDENLKNGFDGLLLYKGSIKEKYNLKDILKQEGVTESNIKNVDVLFLNEKGNTQYSLDTENFIELLNLFEDTSVELSDEMYLIHSIDYRCIINITLKDESRVTLNFMSRNNLDYSNVVIKGESEISYELLFSGEFEKLMNDFISQPSYLYGRGNE